MRHFSTFEFPPPESATSRVLEARGESGQQAVDALEAVLTRIPLVNRLGAHLFLIAEKAGDPVAARPPAGVWPGPFSDGSG